MRQPLYICIFSFVLLWCTKPAFSNYNDSDTEAPAAGVDAYSLEEIEVYARKQTEDLQEVPVSVTSLSNEVLSARGIFRFDRVLNAVPNANQSGGIAGNLQGLVSIRGISTLVRFVGLETGVGYYVDGVYSGRPETFNQPLFDVERVEVLRGPQGTVFGKNTIAGAINIVTIQPSDEFTARFEADYGNYDLLRMRGLAAGPLAGSKLSASIAANYIRRDGIVENVTGIGPDLDALDEASVRGKLRFTPSDKVELMLSSDYLVDRGRPVFFEVSDLSFLDEPTEQTPFTVNQDQPNFLDRDIFGASLTSNVSLGGSANWTTVVGYRDTKFEAAIDDDKAPVRFFSDFFSSDTELFTLETRYSGAISDSLSLLFGAYYYAQEADNVSNFALGDFLTGVPGLEPPIDLISGVDTVSFAVFFNSNWALDDRLSLELGGRFVTEEKTARHIQNDQTGIFGSTDFEANRRDNDFAPSASLSYQVRDNALLFLRYAEGFKSAGFNTDFVNADSNLEAEPEYAKSYEVGAKTALFQNRVRLNLAGFYTDYQNLQLSQITAGSVSLNNAAAADIFGFEAELLAALSPSISIDFAAGYLDASYANFPGCPAPGAEAGPVVDNCRGNILNLAPKWSAAAGVEFRRELAGVGMLFIRADWNYRSQVFFEPQNSSRLSGDGRHLVDLRARLERNRVSFSLWAHNLFDELYVNYADDRSGIFVNTTQAFGEPRTYGLAIGFKY